jgi:hypothetical protein
MTVGENEVTGGASAAAAAAAAVAVLVFVLVVGAAAAVVVRVAEMTVGAPMNATVGKLSLVFVERREQPHRAPARPARTESQAACRGSQAAARAEAETRGRGRRQ